MNHSHSAMAPPAPGKQSPVTVGAFAGVAHFQQQEAAMERSRSAAVVMDDNDDFSSASDLCDQYRQILKQHVSLQNMMSANHIHDDDDDDHESLGSSCYMQDNDNDDVNDKAEDNLDGTVMSRCEVDSLNGSFLSGIDSVKIIRRRKISNHEEQQRRQQQQQHPQEDKSRSGTVSIASAIEDLDDLFDIDDELDKNINKNQNENNETASQGSVSSSSSVYSFDLDFMTSERP